MMTQEIWSALKSPAMSSGINSRVNFGTFKVNTDVLDGGTKAGKDLRQGFPTDIQRS
jgi:hypothetical protein